MGDLPVTGGGHVFDSQAAHAQEPIMRFFRWDHLPPHLQLISAPFEMLANDILKLPRNAERTVALRKLLESKDAAVRAALPSEEGR